MLKSPPAFSAHDNSKDIDKADALSSSFEANGAGFSHLIARAGRQRMLSQRAGLIILVTMSRNDASAFLDGISEFASILEQFRQAHQMIAETIMKGDANSTVFTQSRILMGTRSDVSLKINRFLNSGEELMRHAQDHGYIDVKEANAFAGFVMSDLLAALEHLVSAIQSDADAVSARQNEQRAEDAVTINRSVDDILSAAAYSRMIALNAKIAAGRAGEYGLEFSALTDEIKSIADRISGASEFIRSRLQH